MMNIQPISLSFWPLSLLQDRVQNLSKYPLLQRNKDLSGDVVGREVLLRIKNAAKFTRLILLMPSG